MTTADPIYFKVVSIYIAQNQSHSGDQEHGLQVGKRSS